MTDLTAFLAIDFISPPAFVKYFWAFILIIIIRKCFLVAKAENTNYKCVAALAFFFIAWIIGLATSFATGLVCIIIFIINKIAFLLSIFLAITGLIEIKGNGQIKHSKGQAIWAIALSSLALIWSGYKVYTDIIKKDYLPEVMETSADGGPVEIQEYNFRFKALPEGWKRTAPFPQSEECRFSMIKKSPRLYMMVCSARLGVENDITQETLIDHLVTHVKAISSKYELLYESTHRISHIDGRWYSYNLRIDNIDLNYQAWYALNKGIYYQILIWGRQKLSAVIKREADKIFENFELIDPTLVAYSRTAPASSNKKSALFGYSIDVEGTPWRLWEDLEEDTDECDVGYCLGNGMCFALTPYHLMGLDPDLEDIIPAFFSTYDIEMDDKNLSRIGEIKIGGFNGAKYAYARNVDGQDFEYAFLIYKGEHTAFLLGGWKLKGSKMDLIMVNELFDRVTFSPNEIPFDPDKLTERQTDTQAVIVNKLGVIHYNNSKYEKALACFKMAHSLNNQIELYITNRVDAYESLGQIKEALGFIKENMESFPDSHELKLLKIKMQNKLDMEKESILDYELLFSSEFKDEDELDAYLTLLKDAKMYDKAIKTTSDYYNEDGKNENYITKILQVYEAQKKYKEAYDFLNKHDSNFKNNLLLLSWRAFLETELGMKEAAQKNYEKLFAAGYKSDSDFELYADFLEKNKKYEAALEASKEYYGENPPQSVLVKMSCYLYYLGKHDVAIQMLKEKMEGIPFNLSIGYELDDHYYKQGMYQEAIKVCDKIIKQNSKALWAFYRKGKSQYQSRWYRQAKESVEIALKMKPGDSKIKDLLDNISNVLGEGNNYLVKEKIEPSKIPDTYKVDPKDWDKAWTKEGYNASYIRRLTSVSLLDNGDCVETNYRLIKLLTKGGVESFSSQVIYFNPQDEQVFVNELSVFDDQGNLIAEGDVKNYYVIDDTSSGMASNDKELNLPTPGLEEGYYIRLVYSRKKSGYKKFRLFKHYLCATFPVEKSVFYFWGDMKKIKWVGSEDLISEPLETGCCWKIDHPPIYTSETIQPSASKFMPLIQVNDSKNTWENEGLSYLKLIDDKLKMDPETKQLAEELTKSITKKEDKILALSNYVQSKLTYKAIEFGRRAYIPNPSPLIIKNKYGDCKDHALLLHMLLKGAGVPSNLAFVDTNDSVEEDLPSNDYFNHVIVHIPGEGPGRFVDCTDKDTDTQLPIPYGMSLNKALILDPKKPYLVTLPEYPQGSCDVVSEREIELKENGDVLVKETQVSHGYYAAIMRYYLMSQEAVKRKEAMEDRMRRHGLPIALKELRAENVEQINQPVTLHMEYLIKNHFKPSDNRLIGHIPSPWESYYIYIDPVEKRNNPLCLSYPLVMKTSITIKGPEGWRLGEIKIQDESQDTSFGQWRLKAGIATGGMKADFYYHQITGEHPAEAFNGFQEMRNASIHALKNSLVFSREDD